jgi:hypothetical protein
MRGEPRFYRNAIRVSDLDIREGFRELGIEEVEEKYVEGVGWEIENNIERYFEPKEIMRRIIRRYEGK